MFIRKPNKKQTELSPLFHRKSLKRIEVNTMFLIITLISVSFLSVGYSALSQTLKISGDVSYTYLDQTPTLYNVLKKEALIGTYAKEYTGAHQDSMAGVGDKKIYHWYANDGTEGNTIAEQILNKNNVIFAGFCWQMIRTTDTGGVKMIYNGEANNGQCNASGIDQHIGQSAYNTGSNSLSYVGYMYNKAYTRKTKNFGSRNGVLSTAIIGTNYWYADNISYDSDTSTYSLVNPYQVSSKEDYPNLVGKYTFRSTNKNSTSSNAYYIAAIDNSTMYYIYLYSGNNISYYNYTYTYGDTYTDNGDGTYTIDNPTTIDRVDWYSNYENILHKYVCINATNNTCNQWVYVTKTTKSTITYTTDFTNYKYANGFTYANGKYTLNDDSVTFWDINDSTNKSSFNNHHYTCWNTAGECTTISYIYRNDETTNLKYIDLLNGTSIEEAVNEMLYDEDVNTINSELKNSVDNWYQNNMTSYTSKLEDTIFCNRRSQSNQSTNGWNPNGGSISTPISFSTSNVTDLSCPNDTDKFSVSNNKAQLTYPVGMITAAEKYLLKNVHLKKTGYGYWTMSPSSFEYVSSTNIDINAISSLGGDRVDYSNTSLYVRPVISLKPGTEYSSGTGTTEDPYVVEIPEPVSFETDDWDTIIHAVKTGNTSAYNVGDTKTVDMGSLGTHTIRIANKSTPSECQAEGFSQTACGFVLEFADIITTHNMNSTNTNVGGWPASSMREYVNNDVYNALPTELKNGIISTTVVSGHGSTSGETNFTSTDKMYLFSAYEIYKTNNYRDNYGTENKDTLTGYETRQLDYYANQNTTISNYSGTIKQRNGSNETWWMRSPFAESKQNFGAVNGNGYWLSYYATYAYGVSPAFRIG